MNDERPASQNGPRSAQSSRTEQAFDYIVVGSGAGGGPLAARLALAGKKVLVIEAGADHSDLAPTQAPLEVSLVPSFHGVSTEHPDLSWRFFVEHYEHPPTGPDPKRNRPDAGSGKNKTHDGIFYPRAAALGGCTVHNAMITIAGPDSDWDELAEFLEDESWRSGHMRAYFQRLERNEYGQQPARLPRTFLGRFWQSIRWLLGKEQDYTGGHHGFSGWLHTSVTELSLGLRDRQLVKMLKAALFQSKLAGLDQAWTLVRRFFKGQIFQALDPNHSRTQKEDPEGVVLVPLAVCGKRTTIHQNAATPFAQRGRRSSPREFLLEVAGQHPDKLTIWTNCLVTKVIFEADEQAKRPRAVGVEYRRGERLYRAHTQPNEQPGEPGRVDVAAHGEVILCGGSFNTPQLLMLSGIGDPDHLAEHRLNCLVPSPGVGRNLQDRYEVTVISEMKHDFSLLEGATFSLPAPGEAPDRHLFEWRTFGTGLYTSNGAVLGIFKRSRPELEQPDLFIFGIPLPFKGYEVGYSRSGDVHNQFTWAILKGHTNNHDGTVLLRSADPRDVPLINFHYFNETTSRDRGAVDPDLDALVDGVNFVRGIARRAGSVVLRESHPGFDEVPLKDEQRLRDWIQRVAWGHHACGTCRMGPKDDPLAVLDSRFRVRGTSGLRVVDASVFPKIPGYFIVTNVYVASEKAADTILEDEAAAPGGCPQRSAREQTSYPDAFRRREVEALRKRRAQAGGPAPVDAFGAWAENLSGLAISGGGIRSATFNLGVLQALAKGGALHRFDFMSTVSGGGYVGSFLGRIYDRLRQPQLDGEPKDDTPGAAEAELTDPGSKAVAWLRKHGNYIAPNGQGDARTNIATFVRNFVSVHLVVGTVLFLVFGLLNAIRYGIFDRLLVLPGLIIRGGDLPIGHLVESWLGAFFSPWFIVFELLMFLQFVPRVAGYWLASQDRNERYQTPTLVIVFLLIGGLLFLAVRDGFSWEPLILALSLIAAFFSVELAWWRGRQREAAAGTGGPSTQRLRARNYLTYDLGLSVALLGLVLAFSLIDTAGHALQQRVAGNGTYARTFAQLMAGLLALMPIARGLATFLSGEKKGGPPSTVARLVRGHVSAGLLAVVLLAAPLVFYSFASHAAFGGGSTIGAGLAATTFALLLGLALAHPKAVAFVNRSSLSQVYGARLARAYLGASNPKRGRPEGANVTEVIAGDDVPTILDYRPHESGGPLHLINIALNQTIDFTSLRGNRDRRGENLAVSSLGLNIGRTSHGLWANSEDSAPLAKVAARAPLTVEVVGNAPGEAHPLLDETGMPSPQVETLSLRQWIAISGAAVGPGRGQTTQLGTALLFGLANLRTGYWWDSGIGKAARAGLPRLSFLGRFLYLVPRLLGTQALLLMEWTARYPGPWSRFWHLSDGGFFEVLGGYELIRRRVPRIVVGDASADPNYQFAGLAELTRKVRIDFDACIEPFSEAELEALPPGIRALVGTENDLRAPSDPDGRITPAKKHAALFWVNYLTGSRRRSVLLYLKATVTGDETVDVAQYLASRPEFPHEATADQVFDEAQWESYRQLGLHTAERLFQDRGAWFLDIPLNPPSTPEQ